MVNYGAVTRKAVVNNEKARSSVLLIPVALATVGALALFGTKFSTPFQATGKLTDNVMDPAEFGRHNRENTRFFYETSHDGEGTSHYWLQHIAWAASTGADKTLDPEMLTTGWTCPTDGSLSECSMEFDLEMSRNVSGIKILTPSSADAGAIRQADIMTWGTVTNQHDVQNEQWVHVAQLNTPQLGLGNASTMFYVRYTRRWKIANVKGFPGATTNPTILDLNFHIQPPPTQSPTQAPSVSPTVSPTAHPSTSPTMAPSANPSTSPTMAPSAAPSASPTTAAPTLSPTKAPTIHPCNDGTHGCDQVSGGGICVVIANDEWECACAKAYYCVEGCSKELNHVGHRCVLTSSPTSSPTMAPSTSPTMAPSNAPSASPTMAPSNAPSASPTMAPSNAPSASPTAAPSTSPTMAPSAAPSQSPTMAPSNAPSQSPTMAPSNAPSASPSMAPSNAPSASPSMAPSNAPSMAPSAAPSASPTTAAPTLSPTKAPTIHPCNDGSHGCDQVSGGGICVVIANDEWECACAKAYYCVEGCTKELDHAGHRCVLTSSPTSSPTMAPSAAPSQSPTMAPSAAPSQSPTMAPSNAPSMAPSAAPSQSPTMAPSANPSTSPTMAPSMAPSLSPTTSPTKPWHWDQHSDWVTHADQASVMDDNNQTAWQCDTIPLKNTNGCYIDFDMHNMRTIHGVKVYTTQVSDITVQYSTGEKTDGCHSGGKGAHDVCHYWSDAGAVDMPMVAIDGQLGNATNMFLPAKSQFWRLSNIYGPNQEKPQILQVEFYVSANETSIYYSR